MVDKRPETRFMAQKEIGSEIVFHKAMIQDEKPNDGKGLQGSRWNPKKIQILHKKQPLSGFGIKQKGL